MIDLTARPRHFVGLFLVTLATLMYEILLTRIFSVTMLSHLAFVAVSVAMFGMTVGAILVYLFPGYFRPERTTRQMGLSAVWFGLTVVITFLTHLCIPFAFVPSLIAVYSLALTYTIIALPFV